MVFYLLVECGDRLPRSALVDGCGKPGWNAGCENGGIPYIPAANGYIPAPNNDCVAYKEAAAVKEILSSNISARFTSTTTPKSLKILNDTKIMFRRVSVDILFRKLSRLW